MQERSDDLGESPMKVGLPVGPVVHAPDVEVVVVRHASRVECPYELQVHLEDPVLDGIATGVRGLLTLRARPGDTSPTGSYHRASWSTTRPGSRGHRLASR